VSPSDSRTPNAQPRRYRAGENIEDYCRACQVDRMHAIMVTDGSGQPIRVVCGFCRSEHNYRGGPRTGAIARIRGTVPTTRLGQRDGRQGTSESGRGTDSPTRSQGPTSSSPGIRPPAGPQADPWPLVTARRERFAAAAPAAPATPVEPSPRPESLEPDRDADRDRDFDPDSGPDSGPQSDFAPASDLPDQASELSEPQSEHRSEHPFDQLAEQLAALSPETSMDLELLLRRIIREETGLTPAVPAEKWRGGELVLRPGKPGIAEKSWPIDTFFHKVVMIRNRLRTLEQQLNASDLPDDVKVKLQGYVTGCYGALTSFNILFADESDHFSGSNSD
jgi:hypothetical protein